VTPGSSVTGGNPLEQGIRANLAQFAHQMLQVLLVGLTIGMTRTVVPALAESEFGVPRNSYVLLSSFVIAFGLVKGVMNFVAGRLSDRIGRQRPNVWGMWICGAGVAMMVAGQGVGWWVLSAAVSGFGMALLYPNLSAAVADLADASWRGSAIGIYRFWRDLGYGIGALGLGLAAHFTGQVQAESHPRLRPRPPIPPARPR
jgi:MFS family permease